MRLRHQQKETMHIRTFAASDTAAVSALWAEIFPDDPPHNAPALVIAQKLKCQPELFFVGEIGGVIVGTVLSGYDGHRGWLYSVAVSPRHRREGLGSQLIQHAERALAAIGCTKVNLQVRASNSAVAAFYQELGYVVEERVSMGKRLAAPAI
jgi:ribosomal protein S18 acetylase RimI-like enzyme